MKKMAAVAAVLILLTLCGCGGEKALEAGRYRLTTFKVDGWNLAESCEGSYIQVSGVDDNSVSSLRFYFDAGDDLYLDVFTGYLETVNTTAEYSQYRFWVISYAGEFFSNDSEYLTWYYYPDGKKIEMLGTENIKFAFEKE